MCTCERSFVWAQEAQFDFQKKHPLAATWQPLAAATWGKCLRVAASGCQVAAKWLQVAAKWLQVAAKWLQVAAKWLQVAASGCLSKWEQVGASGSKWLQVAALACKWQVAPWASGCKWLLESWASGRRRLQVAAWASGNSTKRVAIFLCFWLKDFVYNVPPVR